MAARDILAVSEQSKKLHNLLTRLKPRRENLRLWQGEIIFAVSGLFFVILSLVTDYHLTADDFSFYSQYHACPGGCSLTDTFGAKTFKEICTVIWYFFLKFLPESTGPILIVFQLLHVLSGYLLFRYLGKSFPQLKGRYPFFPAFAALLFIFHPGHFEILYWRITAPYTMGSIAALAAALLVNRRPNVAALLLSLSYFIFESFLFSGLLIILPLMFRHGEIISNWRDLPLLPQKIWQSIWLGERKSLYAVAFSFVIFFVGRMGLAVWGDTQMLRHSINIGYLGFDWLRRVGDYLDFTVSIHTSMKLHAGPSWAFKAVLLLLCIQYVLQTKNAARGFIWGLLAALCVVLGMLPATLVGHFVPRATTLGLMYFAIFAGLWLARGHFKAMVFILIIFIWAHGFGSLRMSVNSKKFSARLEKLEKEIIESNLIKAALHIDISQLKRGYVKDWFLQHGDLAGYLTIKWRQKYPKSQLMFVNHCDSRNSKCANLVFNEHAQARLAPAKL